MAGADPKVYCKCRVRIGAARQRVRSVLCHHLSQHLSPRMHGMTRSLRRPGTTGCRHLRTRRVHITQYRSARHRDRIPAVLPCIYLAGARPAKRTFHSPSHLACATTSLYLLRGFFGARTEGRIEPRTKREDADSHCPKDVRRSVQSRPTKSVRQICIADWNNCYRRSIHA